MIQLGPLLGVSGCAGHTLGDNKSQQSKAKIRSLCNIPRAQPWAPPPTIANFCHAQHHTGLNWGLLVLGLMEEQRSVAPKGTSVGLYQDLAPFLETQFWGGCVASVGVSLQWA